MLLYDYLYVDLPKVISLYSQITGGVVESRETSHEQDRSADNKRNYDFKVFRHDAGGTEHRNKGSEPFTRPQRPVRLHAVIPKRAATCPANPAFICRTCPRT